MDLYHQEGMKPHNSKIEPPSGLSWDTARFVLAAPGLGGFPSLPPAVGGMVHHLGAAGPCQDAQLCGGSAHCGCGRQGWGCTRGEKMLLTSALAATKASSMCPGEGA